MHDFDILREIEILNYILKQIDDIETFTNSLDEDMYLRNELVKNASLMKLIVLGEYTTHVDQKLKSRFDEVQWQFIKAARNYYAHVYRGIDWIKVWETIYKDLPLLKVKLEFIIQSLEKENNAKTN